VNIKKIFKWLSWLLGALFIGGLSSGFWENFLKPLFGFLANLIVGILSNAFASYRDSIYVEAAKGFHEYYSMSLYLILMMILPMVYYCMVKLHPSKRNRKSHKIERGVGQFLLSKNGYRCIIVATLIVFVFSALETSKQIVINNTATYTLNSIEIVRPYIEANEYFLMKSQYYTMKNFSDFNKIEEKINKITKKENVVLPDR
jgi:hypothetical protein